MCRASILSCSCFFTLCFSLIFSQQLLVTLVRETTPTMDHEENTNSSAVHLLVSLPDIDANNNNNNNNTTSETERPKAPSSSSLSCIGGEWVKSIVYAGLDAIVTCFALISSISASGNLSSMDVLVLGFANLVADGISMGFGDFVSSSTERDMAVKEREVTDWEVTNNGGSQQRELLQKYQTLGMSIDDATNVVNVFSKYKDLLVDEKMTVQKRILPAEQAEKPWKNGVVTFVAFLVFGSAPLLSFIILIPFTENESFKFSGACILSALALAFLGMAKAKIAGQDYALSIFTTLFNGAIAAASAYFIGWALRNVAGLHE